MWQKKYNKSLPENPNLPSVSAFAECLGLCRKLRHGHSAKTWFAECQATSTRQNLPHGIPKRCRVPAVSKNWHSATFPFCRVLARRHSAKTAHVPSTRARRAPPVRGGWRRQVFAECYEYYFADVLLNLRAWKEEHFFQVCTYSWELS